MVTDHGLPDSIRVLAPSDVAALNIHSALGLPVNSDFIELKGFRLARFQQACSGVHLTMTRNQCWVYEC